MADLVLQRAIGGEQQQPLAVGVQPAGGINVGDADIVRQAGMLGVRGKLADHAIRFVEQDQFRHLRLSGEC